MRMASIKNWAEFQHYKERTPPWIKLHRGLLDDFDFQCLPVASRALAPMLWLLAAEHKDGLVCIDPDRIAFRLRMSAKEAAQAVTPLIEKGFLIVASGVLADCKQDAIPETETEAETEAETEKSCASAKRGTRLPADWKPTANELQWAKRERPDVDATREAESFADYWHAKPGAAGSKLDWTATWRNWIRNSRARSSPAQPPMAQQFADKTYTGTPDDELPDFLRADAR